MSLRIYILVRLDCALVTLSPLITWTRTGVLATAAGFNSVPHMGSLSQRGFLPLLVGLRIVLILILIENVSQDRGWTAKTLIVDRVRVFRLKPEQEKQLTIILGFKLIISGSPPEAQELISEGQLINVIMR